MLILALLQSRKKEKHLQSEKSLAFNIVIRFIIETLVLWALSFYWFIITTESVRNFSLEDVKIAEKHFFLGA